VAQSTVKLIVDAQNAIRPLQRVNEQTKALSSSTDKLKGRLDKSNRSLKNTGSSARTASTGVKSLVGALRPLLAALAVVGSARFVLFQTSQLETQTKALEVLTGSAEKAKKIVQEIKAFGSVTPFKSSDLIEVTKRLKAFGFETENVVDITKRVADIAGTAGADINNVALAIGKVQAKNKFMQEENVMLLEKGINVTKELEKIMNMNGETLAKAMSKGEVGADKFVQALINLTSEGGEFFKGASKQSDTLAGKFSTLEDGVETLAQLVGEKLKPALKGALDVAIDLVTNINQAIAAGSITDVDKKALQKQAQAIVKEQAGGPFGMVGGPFGMGEVSVGFQGKEFKGQPAAVQSQITNALINAEVAKRLKEQLEVQQKLAKATNNIRKINVKNGQIVEITKDKTKETTLAYSEGLIPSSDLFNQNLGQSNIFMESISNGTEKLSEGLVNVKSEADQLKEKFMEIGQGIEDGIVSGLTDAVMGTKTLAQAAIGVLNDLKRKLVEVAMQRAVSGIGNFLGNALGGLFGGGGGGLVGNKASSFLGGVANPIAGMFANGGNPPVGRASIVGEKGPELFVPRSAGTIIPNNAMGGGVTNIVTVNVDANSSNVSGNNADANQLGNQIAIAIQSELIKQKRAGGLLA
jgi:hypothetical protein